MLPRPALARLDREFDDTNSQPARPEPFLAGAAASTPPPEGICRRRDRAPGGDAGPGAKFALRWAVEPPRRIQAGSTGGADHSAACRAPRHHAQHDSPGDGPRLYRTAPVVLAGPRARAAGFTLRSEPRGNGDATVDPAGNEADEGEASHAGGAGCPPARALAGSSRHFARLRPPPSRRPR